MLDPCEGPRGALRRPPGDPIAGLTIALLALLGIGLLVVAILAVYDYALPKALGPLVLILTALFGVALALNVSAVTVRFLRRPGR